MNMQNVVSAVKYVVIYVLICTCIFYIGLSGFLMVHDYYPAFTSDRIHMPADGLGNYQITKEVRLYIFFCFNRVSDWPRDIWFSL